MTTVSTLYVGTPRDAETLLERRVREAERAGAGVIRIDADEPPVATTVRLVGLTTTLPHRSSWRTHLLVAVVGADQLSGSQQRALARIAEVGEERGVTVVATAEAPVLALATLLEVPARPRHLRLVKPEG
ncbi:hypothetical protein [Nocardioides sp. KR10-350]|uniref:hypothetical protein n=1 Tax=Nocardioides cheoyonin TaxID=3156615 RepID=UPI0032B46F5F